MHFAHLRIHADDTAGGGGGESTTSAACLHRLGIAIVFAELAEPHRRYGVYSRSSNRSVRRFTHSHFVFHPRKARVQVLASHGHQRQRQ